MFTVRIYVSNLHAYNAGRIVGKWLELPMEEEELASEIKEILKMNYPEKCGEDEEYFITDYEAPFEIKEFESPFYLNQKLWELNDLLQKWSIDEKYYKIIGKLIDERGFEEVIGILEEGDFILHEGVESMLDIAYQYAESCMNIPDELAPYIDYKLIAGELELSGNYYFDEENEVCIEILD